MSEISFLSEQLKRAFDGDAVISAADSSEIAIVAD
jgi:hypothetical protein